MNVLVTGGAGYIGSVVSDALLAEGHDVVVYDDLRKGHRAAVAADARLIEADLADEVSLSAALTRYNVDAVVHMAGYIQVGESTVDPGKYFDNNVAASLVLLRAMISTGVRKLVYSSSAAVYGEPMQTPIPEKHPTAPTSPYGLSKLVIEQMLPWYDRACGLRYASLRYFNAAGATESRGEDHDPETHLIPLVLQVAMGRRQAVEVYGVDYPTRDGTCVRDYIHVADLATAHVLALGRLERGSCVYNLGNGEGFTVREVIDTARRVTGHPIPVVESDRRPGDPAVLVAGSERLRRDLGWTPRMPDLADIVESAWRWMSAHPGGYDG